LGFEVMPLGVIRFGLPAFGKLPTLCSGTPLAEILTMPELSRISDLAPLSCTFAAPKRSGSAFTSS